MRRVANAVQAGGWARVRPGYGFVMFGLIALLGGTLLGSLRAPGWSVDTEAAAVPDVFFLEQEAAKVATIARVNGDIAREVDVDRASANGSPTTRIPGSGAASAPDGGSDRGGPHADLADASGSADASGEAANGQSNASANPDADATDGSPKGTGADAGAATGSGSGGTGGTATNPTAGSGSTSDTGGTAGTDPGPTTDTTIRVNGNSGSAGKAHERSKSASLTTNEATLTTEQP
jgi:hypothetical protein